MPPRRSRSTAPHHSDDAAPTARAPSRARESASPARSPARASTASVPKSRGAKPARGTHSAIADAATTAAPAATALAPSPAARDLFPVGIPSRAPLPPFIPHVPLPWRAAPSPAAAASAYSRATQLGLLLLLAGLALRYRAFLHSYLWDWHITWDGSASLLLYAGVLLALAAPRLARSAMYRSSPAAAAGARADAAAGSSSGSSWLCCCGGGGGGKRGGARGPPRSTAAAAAGADAAAETTFDFEVLNGGYGRDEASLATLLAGIAAADAEAARATGGTLEYPAAGRAFPTELAGLTRTAPAGGAVPAAVIRGQPVAAAAAAAGDNNSDGSGSENDDNEEEEEDEQKGRGKAAVAAARGRRQSVAVAAANKAKAGVRARTARGSTVAAAVAVAAASDAESEAEAEVDAADVSTPPVVAAATGTESAAETDVETAAAAADGGLAKMRTAALALSATLSHIIRATQSPFTTASVNADAKKSDAHDSATQNADGSAAARASAERALPSGRVVPFLGAMTAAPTVALTTPTSKTVFKSSKPSEKGSKKAADSNRGKADDKAVSKAKAAKKGSSKDARGDFAADAAALLHDELAARAPVWDAARAVQTAALTENFAAQLSALGPECHPGQLARLWEAALRPARVLVFDWSGDIFASGTDLLAKFVDFAVQTCVPGKDEVVLCLESGGGAVPHYGRAAYELARLREHGIHLTVCVDKVAASGGYMMAAVADRIVAAPFAYVGYVAIIITLYDSRVIFLLFVRCCSISFFLNPFLTIRTFFFLSATARWA